MAGGAKARDVVVDGFPTTLVLTDEQYAAYEQNEAQQLADPPGEPQTSEVETKKRSTSGSGSTAKNK